MDWYDYLTEDFKKHRKSYRVSEKAVFTCPTCGNADVVRLAHAKEKIKKIGKYECSRCRKRDSIARARASRSYLRRLSNVTESEV